MFQTKEAIGLALGGVAPVSPATDAPPSPICSSV